MNKRHFYTTTYAYFAEPDAEADDVDWYIRCLHFGVLSLLHRSNSMPESGETPVKGPKSVSTVTHLQSNSRHVQPYLLRRPRPMPFRSPDCGKLPGPDNGVLDRLGSFFNCRSNEWSCCIKWKLGEMSGFLARTNEKASFRLRERAYIR